MDKDNDILTGELPPIPTKRYFTIGEVGELCQIKPHVLRYWEQEFSQLRPVKRRGNRRYYQHHEVVLVRKIRDLLYNHGFTISGARAKLERGAVPAEDQASKITETNIKTINNSTIESNNIASINNEAVVAHTPHYSEKISPVFAQFIRQELNSIKQILALS